jgi:hypothetical protein
LSYKFETLVKEKDALQEQIDQMSQHQNSMKQCIVCRELFSPILNDAV